MVRNPRFHTIAALAASVHIAGCSLDGRSAENTECGPCAIVFEEIAVLGQPTDPASVQLLTGVIAFASDNILAGPVTSGGELLLFDRQGALLKVVGRRGSGPGHLSSQFELIAADGSRARVLDRTLRKLVTIDGNGDILFERAAAIAASYYSAAVLDDARLVFSAPLRSPGPSLLYMIDATGLAAPIGSSAGQRFDREHELLRIVASARSPERFWSSRLDSLHVELMDGRGNVLRTIAHNVAWLQPGFEPALMARWPPPPLVQRIWEDAEGRLWMVAHVPGTDERVDLTGAPAATALEPAMLDHYLDTIVAVLDAESGAVIAEHRDARFLRFSPDGTVAYRLLETEGGDLRGQLFGYSLTR